MKYMMDPSYQVKEARVAHEQSESDPPKAGKQVEKITILGKYIVNISNPRKGITRAIPF